MDLLKDNIKKLYFRFLIPSLGSAMVLSIYTMTDAIVIGKGVGADALAALSITTPVLCLLMATGILFGVGGSVHMNIQRGLHNEAKARRFFTVSLILISAVALFLWIVYRLYTPEILHLMGATEKLFPYAASYMGWFNYFLPVAVFSNYLAIFVRNDNDPNRAMAGVIGGGILNIVLDIVLVFPFKCGIGGAAIASCLGMCLQILIVSSHFLTKKNTLKLIRPHHFFQTAGLIISGGTSSFVNELANGVIVFLFNIQILKYCGTIALSVYSVISNCVILFNSLFTGVGQAIQPIVSTNFGAGQHERIQHLKRMSLTTIFSMGLLFSLSGILFPYLVCGIFLPLTPQIKEIANYGIRLYFIAFLPMGWNIVNTYYLQSILASKTSLVISITRNIILSGGLILLLPVFCDGSVLWYTMPIVELTVLCGYYLYTFVHRRTTH